MPKDNKTRSEHILDALIDNKTLLLSDITKRVSESAGKEVKIQNISSLMAKLNNPGKSQTGHFIIKTKTPNGFEYSLVPEILALAPEEVHGLTRKMGKNRFTLEMAVEKIPKLAQYVKKTGKVKASRKKMSAKKSRVTKQKSKARAVKGKPDRKTLPKPVQKADVGDVVAGFLHEMDKMGGLKVNVYLTVRLLKG